MPDAINLFDIAVLALILLLGYQGWRRGAVAVVLGIAGGVLAFVLAALLAPLLAPVVTPLLGGRLGVPEAFVRPLIVVLLTLALRFALGFALRELAAATTSMIRAVPPLALLDRALGVLPMALFGALLGVVVVAGALALPRDAGVRDRAEQSWVARNVLAEPGRTWQRGRDAFEALLSGSLPWRS